MRKRSNESTLFTDILSTMTKYFKYAVVIMVLIICFSGVRFIKSGNVALILRFGSLVGDTYEEQVHQPGLLLAFPYIIDEVVIVPTGNVIEQKITTHYTENYMQGWKKDGYLITGDQNIAVISACVKYKITDPTAYALNVKDIEGIVNGSISNAMVEVAANMAVDDILTAGKEAYISSTIGVAQNELDIVGTGITIVNLELTQVSMPKDVQNIYEQVNSATVEASTLLEDAQKYRDTKIPAAESEAAVLISKANSEHSEATSVANQAVAEFWGLLDEYKLNRALVRTRIYNEKISEAISKIGTVKIVQDGDSKIFIN